MTKQKLIFYDETLKVLYSADYVNNTEKSPLSMNSDEGDIAILISNDFSFFKFEIPDTSQRNLKKVNTLPTHYEYLKENIYNGEE